MKHTQKTILDISHQPVPANIISLRNRSIDALRAIATLLVVFLHCYIPFMGMSSYDAFLRFFYHYGSYGVDLFFILSGFCIHWGNSKPGKKFFVKDYLLRRWWRIYPPYFFALALAVFLNIVTNAVKWTHGGTISLINFGPGQILSHLFLVHNFFKSTLATISGPFWTIAVEMQFYLLYLLARRYFFSLKGWIFTFLLAIVLHFSCTYLISLNGWFQPWHALQYWFEWVLGAYLAYLLRKEHHLLQYWNLWLILFLAFCFLAVQVDTQKMQATFEYRQYLLVGAFVFLILLLFHWEKIWSFWGLRWIPFLGTFSYSVYLIHFLMLDRIRIFFIPRFDPGAVRVAISLMAVSLALGASYAFFRFFEKPFMEKSANWKAWDAIH